MTYLPSKEKGHSNDLGVYLLGEIKRKFIHVLLKIKEQIMLNLHILGYSSDLHSYTASTLSVCPHLSCLHGPLPFVDHGQIA
jgi:hypothetical protein